MTAGRFIVEGDAIEVAVWTVFFALHPPAEDGENGAAAPIDPPFPIKGPTPAVFAEPASADIPTPSRPAVMAGPKAGHDAPSGSEERGADDVERGASPEPVTADDAAAFARLSAGERRAVLLMRKHRDRNAVAKIMEINPNSVTNYISAARNKGVQI